MTLPIKCPLCNAGSDVQTVTTSHVYGDESGKRAFFQCDNCNVFYQHPPLSKEEEILFYKEEFESFMSNRSGHKSGWDTAENHIKANEITRTRRLKYLEPYIKQKSNILEIGCSSGFMLIPFHNEGLKCTGIEPSGVFSEYVKSKGITIYSSIEELELKSPEEKFDLITHYFVLEHITEPKTFLEKQINLLKDNGTIIFEIPNSADPLYSVYDIPSFERFYWSKAHPWYFNEASISFLIDQLDCEYQIMLDQRYDLSNHICWARDGKPGGMGKFTDKLGKRMEELYKNELIRTGICDTLIVVMKK